MQDIERLWQIEPTAGNDSNSRDIESSEHKLSIGIAQAMKRLSMLNEHYSSHSNYRMPEDEAAELEDEVQRVYYQYVEPRRAYLYSDDEPYEPLPGEHPMQMKVVSVQGALREIWHEQYYERRSHAATPDDFRQWLESYMEQNGPSAREHIIRGGMTFRDTYRPSGSAGGKDHDLRAAEKDILLLQGCGSAAISVLEMPGTRVEMAKSGIPHHNLIYTLDSPRQRIIGKIAIPADIFATTQGLVR